MHHEGPQPALICFPPSSAGADSRGPIYVPLPVLISQPPPALAFLCGWDLCPTHPKRACGSEGAPVHAVGVAVPAQAVPFHVRVPRPPPLQQELQRLARGCPPHGHSISTPAIQPATLGESGQGGARLHWALSLHIPASGRGIQAALMRLGGGSACQGWTARGGALSHLLSLLILVTEGWQEAGVGVGGLQWDGTARDGMRQTHRSWGLCAPLPLGRGCSSAEERLASSVRALDPQGRACAGKPCYATLISPGVLEESWWRLGRPSRGGTDGIAR